MLRSLYLLRHGTAEQNYFVSDFDRSLTAEGVIQVRNLGLKLRKEDFYPSITYCSSANRTRQTADIFLEQLDYVLPVKFQKSIYEAPTRVLFEIVVNCADEFDSLLLIGHNPGLSHLCEYLSGNSYVDMHPGRLVRLDFDDVSWSEISKSSGTLIEFP